MTDVLGLRKRGRPTKEFAHTADCKIVKADPDVRIEWVEEERGHWSATCACGVENVYVPTEDRVRLDPLDARTSHHLPQCELVGETNPSVLRLSLRVTPKDGYSWIECVTCGGSWQVPTYSASKEA